MAHPRGLQIGFTTEEMNISVDVADSMSFRQPEDSHSKIKLKFCVSNYYSFSVEIPMFSGTAFRTSP